MLPRGSGSCGTTGTVGYLVQNVHLHLLLMFSFTVKRLSSAKPNIRAKNFIHYFSSIEFSYVAIKQYLKLLLNG